MEQSYLSPEQVGTIYPGLTADRLARWRWAKVGPSYMKAGRQILYRGQDIEAYLASVTVEVSNAR